MFLLQEEAKRELESGDEFIEITVTSPHKVGEGMSSFMAYKLITKTNLSYFKKQQLEVNRRFSDFLGLRDKLCEKYLQNGRIIPPCPDKSVIGMTKVKMSKEDEASNQSGKEKQDGSISSSDSLMIFDCCSCLNIEDRQHFCN